MPVTVQSISWRLLFTVTVAVTLFCFPALSAAAIDLQQCETLLRSGRLEECHAAASTAIKEGRYGEDWHLLKARVELQRGRYTQAKETLDVALTKYTWSIRLRLLAHTACQHTDQKAAAQEHLARIVKEAENTPWRFTGVDDLLVLGRAAELSGADARDVLTKYYDKARQQSPARREGWLACIRLSLEKQDYPLAVELLEEALTKFPEDAELQFTAVHGFELDDPERSRAALLKTLELHPEYAPALLYQADELIAQEQYAAAREKLQEVLKVHPTQPQALARLAVIATLQNLPEEAETHRYLALSTWSENPEVDYLIGLGLSRKYRFAEAVRHQEQALKLAPGYALAQIQLSQDYLRLGKEQAGWELADQAAKKDPYNVACYNLMELHDQLSRFKTLEDEHFIVRMEAGEADIYGQRVLRLLNRARQKLCAKYELELQDKIIVEIFPDENDFAVRTFGMPGSSGYLGVCFGRVITANSPASQTEHPSNWESVLWHEFCHVVTLHVTQNRMPRWLSEGISVYEELQENPAWGQRMIRPYVDLIENGELTLIRDLSGAFLSPKSGLHVQFAYYESAMVVEYLVENYGLETLKKVLHDCRAGLPVNAALDRHTDGLEELETGFQDYIQKKIQEFAPGAEWETAELDNLLQDDGDALPQWLQKHPTNIPALKAQSARYMDNREFQKAIPLLEKVIELYPHDTAPDSGYVMLGEVYMSLQQTEKERELLEQFHQLSSDSLPTRLRLLELYRDDNQWAEVQRVGEELLAINPLIAEPHHSLMEASEELNLPALGIEACRALLLMEPHDPAQVHYKLAQFLHAKNDPEARRQLLLALEHAPRFQAALKLLVQLDRQEN